MATVNNNTSLTLPKPTEAAKDSNSKEGYYWCSLFITEAVVIIVLNILTIIVFVKKRGVRKRSTYLLINLSVTDTGVGALVLPTSIFRRGNTYGLWNVHMPPKWLISTYGIDTFFFGCSLVFLVSISIERLHAMKHPMRHRLISSSSYKKWILGVWAASVIYTSITVSFLYFDIFGQQFWYIVAGCVLVSLLILSSCYMAIFVTVQRSKQPELTTRHARTERKLTMTLFIVTLVSLSVWLPYVLFTFLEFKLSRSFSVEALLRLRSVCETLFFANSFVNPILYTIRMPEFRKAISSLISTWFLCRSRICQRTTLQSNRGKPHSLKQNLETNSGEVTLSAVRMI